jgi:hypothetical protein
MRSKPSWRPIKNLSFSGTAQDWQDQQDVLAGRVSDLLLRLDNTLKIAKDD